MTCVFAPGQEPVDPSFATQCVGKHRFSSKGDALKAIRKMKSAVGKRNRGALEAYRCPHCSGFHMGGRNGR